MIGQVPETKRFLEGSERQPTREVVIESLRKDPPYTTLLIFYMEGREQQVQAKYIGRDDQERFAFNYNMELPELYRDAGLREEALEAYHDVLEMAYAQGKDDDTISMIVKEIAKLTQKQKSGEAF